MFNQNAAEINNIQVNNFYYPGATGNGFFPVQPQFGVASPWQNSGVAMQMINPGYLRSLYTFERVLGRECCCCCCCDDDKSKRIEEDPYGIGECGQGARSNLANSPEAMLALNDIFSKEGGKSYDDAAKELKDKYGIDAKVADIKTTGKDGKEMTVKGIQLANGDYFVDSNGNNQLDAGDYKFSDAVKNLKDKYGLNDDDLTKIVQQMKDNAQSSNNFQNMSGNAQNFFMQNLFAQNSFGSGAGSPNLFAQNAFGTNFPPSLSDPITRLWIQAYLSAN